jgi:hypothetical protein
MLFMIKPKLTAFLLVLFACWYQGFAQTGTINMVIQSPKVITFPYTLQTVGDNLGVQVLITSSTYQINSVTASLPGGQSVALSYSGPSTGYTGNMSLLGLPQDTTKLTVTAVDIYNNTVTSTAAFVYDHPPTVSVDSPAAYTVATPNLHFRSRCHSDSGACTINVVLQVQPSVNVTLGSYTDSIDAQYDLTAYEGQNGGGTNSMMLVVSAADKRGVGANLPQIPVYVETSPYLTPVFSADKKIYDLANNKVFVMQDGVLSLPHIADITNGSVTNIPFTGYIPQSGHLTSHGAVFLGNSASDVAGAAQNVFEWHDGSLDSLGRQTSVATFVPAGDYATYLDASGATILRNLATQTDKSIGISNAGNQTISVSPSGVVAYPTTGSKTREIIWNLFDFATGSSSVLVDDSSGKAYYRPMTDGRHIVYDRQYFDLNGNYAYNIMFGGGSNYFDTLATFDPQYPLPSPIPYSPNYFLIDNGYTAYEAPNSQGVDQVWIRDTTGRKMQITFGGAGTSSSLEYLNPKGEVTYLLPGQVISPSQRIPPARALYTPAGGAVRIGGMQGQAYYMDSAWYVVIGRTVFRLNAAISPNKSDNFTVNVKPDSLYGFTAGIFDAHFEGGGYPTSVVFTRLPAHGTLVANGSTVVANMAVPRASLATLVYTPATGFTGVDTIKWFGTTDFTTSVDTALILLNVANIVPPPAQPAISGLASTYCSNGGTGVFTMTNFPDTVAGATLVTDTLDGQVLAIGAGASCSITLSDLSAGVHMVKVTYANAGGTSNLVQTFTVVPASTPVIQLNASYQTIPATAASVAVRADAVSGGGIYPQFTFALNNNFAPVLYGPGATDSVVIDTAALKPGANTVYARLQTSDSCYTVLNVTDSIVITRTVDTTGNNNGGNNNNNNGGNNNNNNSNDSTSSTVTVGPNPFVDQLVVSGLDASHTHTMLLLNGNGMEVLRTRVSGVNHTMLYPGVLPQGIYLMRVFDETSGKMIRQVKLMSFPN